MAAKKINKTDVKKMQEKQAKQAKTIDQYKKQSKWIGWSAAVILLLILFSFLTMGYASNWWQGTTRTSQFTPGSAGTAASATDGTGTSANTATTTTGTGGGKSTTTTTTTPGTNTSSTTNNTSTTTTTNNTTTQPTSQPSGVLLTLYNDSGLGKSTNDVISEADSLGVEHNCVVQLLTVQTCTFTVGNYSFTTKNLLSSNAITGLSSNF